MERIRSVKKPFFAAAFAAAGFYAEGIASEMLRPMGLDPETIGKMLLGWFL